MYIHINGKQKLITKDGLETDPEADEKAISKALKKAIDWIEV